MRKTIDPKLPEKKTNHLIIVKWENQKAVDVFDLDPDIELDANSDTLPICCIFLPEISSLKRYQIKC